MPISHLAKAGATKINQVCFTYMYYKVNYLIRLYIYMKDHVANQFSVLLGLNTFFHYHWI